MAKSQSKPVAAPSAVFTPGPWRVDDSQGGWMVRCPCRGLEDIREADGKVCYVGYRPNAYLISAAPELLEALKAAKREMWAEARHSWTLADFKNWAVIQQIDAALAKATGQ